MNAIVKRINAAEAAQMESKINHFLSDPANAGFAVAAAFEADNGDIVVIFQKP
jgi:hypothetical protein